MATKLMQLDSLLAQGFKIEMRGVGRSEEYLVQLVLESPQGERVSGHGPTLDEAIVNGLIHLALKLEEYLVRAENDRDLYKRGMVKLTDLPLRMDPLALARLTDEGGTDEHSAQS